jgi:hypothetical protein
MINFSNDLLIKFLLFLLIFIVIDFILKRTKIVKGISATIIALAISLLAIFYMDYSELNFLAQTYNLTGTIILISIPFLIIFYFIYSIDLTGIFRKITWLIYGIANIVILNSMENIPSDQKSLITIWTVIIIAIILLIDKQISNILNTRKNLKHYK